MNDVREKATFATIRQRLLRGCTSTIWYIYIIIYNAIKACSAKPCFSQTRWSVLQYQCRVICQLNMFFQSQMLTLEGTLLLKTPQLLANTHLTSFTFNLSFVCFHFPQFHTPGKHHRTLHQHPLKVPQGIPQCPDLTGETWWKAWIMTNLHHLCSAFGTWPRELCRLPETYWDILLINTNMRVIENTFRYKNTVETTKTRKGPTKIQHDCGWVSDRGI